MDGQYYFSTRQLASPQMFDAWHHEYTTIFDVEVDRARHIDCSIRGGRIGDVLLFQQHWTHQQDALPAVLKRGPPRARRDGYDFYYLRMGVSQPACFTTRKQRVCALPGQPCLIDTAQDVRGELLLADTVAAAIPREVVHGSVADRHGTLIEGELGCILGDYLMSLARSLPRLSTHDSARLSTAIAPLLNACLAPSPETLEHAGEQLRLHRFDRVRRFIDHHLDAPWLSPGRICTGAGVSRSSLYRLFSDKGGVSHYVQRRRLLRIRHLLASGQARGPISELAYRYGFTNDSHFGRVFKAAFGFTPSEARDLGAHGAVMPSRCAPSSAQTLAHVLSGI